MVTLECAGVARGKRDSPEHPHGSRGALAALCGRRGDGGTPESAEMWYRRRHGCDMPVPLIPSGGGGRIRIGVLGGLARTRAGVEEAGSWRQ